MSLLLLFHGAGAPPPAFSGSAAASAGASARATARLAAAGLAAARAGAYAAAFGGMGVGGSAVAKAGAQAIVGRAGLGLHGTAAAAAGAYARGVGGKGIPGRPTAVLAGATARARAKPLRIGVPLSRLTRLVLALDPSDVTFTVVGQSGPYPLLLSVGTLRLAARAGRATGIGTTESTSLTLQLDNSGRRAAAIIGRALRVQATVYDGENQFFTGTVSQITYGTTIDIVIEA